MSLESAYLGAFEEHSPKEIRAALDAGASPVELIKGKRPIDILIEMYTRSPRFADCLRVMLEAGALIEDPLLEAVLLDDADALRRLAKTSGQSLQRQLSLLSAYTSCKGVSALHVCAEFNSVRCAAVLIEAAVDVNVQAAVDADGLGGQTPLFHAVNSNHNHCRPVMELLVEAGANLEVRLNGLIWGESFAWETVVFDVTPISYAQCGLYRQFHRREADVYSNIEYLYGKRHRKAPRVLNVPNKYLFGS
jgi:ankyrin repeat protein